MSLMKLRRNRKGFTLIEMMIVIAVIAILAAVLIPKSGLVQNAAKESGVEANARVVQGIIEGMLPRYEASEYGTLKADLKDKLNAKVKNPINAVYTVSDVATTISVLTADAAVAISPDTKPAEDPANAGVVWVVIEDNLSSIVIYPCDKDGAPIAKAELTVK